MAEVDIDLAAPKTVQFQVVTPQAGVAGLVRLFAGDDAYYLAHTKRGLSYITYEFEIDDKRVRFKNDASALSEVAIDAEARFKLDITAVNSGLDPATMTVLITEGDLTKLAELNFVQNAVTKADKKATERTEKDGGATEWTVTFRVKLI